MSKAHLKIMTWVVVLLLALNVTTNLFSTVYASSTNAIQNSGFELSTSWEARYSSFLGGYAKVRDSSYKHTGSYSGLTHTLYPKQEYCSASLYQSLNVPVQNLSTFYYWIRKGESAVSGYYHGQACIHLSGGYKLYYYHGFDWSSPPSDGTTYKYINAGNPKTNFWIQISRNLCTDLVNKFGSSVLARTVTGIELYSHGSKDLITQEMFGQRVNWDDVFVESEQVVHIISLASSTIDGYTNVGNITFDGSVYTLPNSVEKNVSAYNVTANPPEEYFFDHWEVSGGLMIANSSSQTTMVTVTDSGTLEAVFTTRLWTFIVYLCGDNDLDYFARVNINDMEKVGSTEEITILAMLDRDDTDGVRPEPGQRIWQKYMENRYYITKDNDPDTINSPILWSESEVNMGDPNTLVDFVKWSFQLYPARHYALVLMNHGGGYEGICIDIQPNNYYDPDTLEMPELKWALSKIENDTGTTVNLFGCDACLMGQTEVVYQIKDYAEVFVGSEEVEYAPGWPYSWILGNLTGNPLMNAEDLGIQIVTSYKDYSELYLYNSSIYEYPQTMSAINMSIIQNVAVSISNLGNWLKDNLSTYEAEIDWARQNVIEYYGGASDFVDAYHLAQLLQQNISDSTLQQICQQVQQNITEAVISEWHRSDADGSHGLTLFFPNQTSEYENEYDLIQMSIICNWDEFLKEYLGI